MRCRVLGSSGLRVSELFLGAMTFAEGFAHGPGGDEARRIVDAYLAGGATSSTPRSTTATAPAKRSLARS
jgi:aryl-alcohol dehydrogenase-like predicted oxidoreductase